MTVAAVDRCISMIEALAAAPDPLELSELAARVGLPQSAAHRTLTTLVARGWVTQDPASQNYALSLRLAQLAFLMLDQRHAPDLVQAALDRLAARTEEYCRLAIVEDGRLVWVARAQGARAGLRYDPDMGGEIVLHATANGKAWLSTMPENKAMELAYAGGLAARPGLGPNGVRSVDDLRSHLAQARAQGYATAVEEAEPGTAALAVPFRAHEGSAAPVAGTISIAGPTLRIRPARYSALHAELARTAREIAAIWPLRQRMRNRPALGLPQAEGATGAAGASGSADGQAASVSSGGAA